MLIKKIIVREIILNIAVTKPFFLVESCSQDTTANVGVLYVYLTIILYYHRQIVITIAICITLSRISVRFRLNFQQSPMSLLSLFFLSVKYFIFLTSFRLFLIYI